MVITTKCEHINSLDLEPMIEALSNPEDPLTYSSGWPRAVAEKIAQQYKAFLYIIKAYPEQRPFVPFREVDEFWHAHILNTKKYVKDCESIFGFYVHHYPHKQKTEEDKDFYAKHFQKTVDTLTKEFPEIE